MGSVQASSRETRRRALSSTGNRSRHAAARNWRPHRRRGRELSRTSPPWSCRAVHQPSTIGRSPTRPRRRASSSATCASSSPSRTKSSRRPLKRLGLAPPLLDAPPPRWRSTTGGGRRRTRREAEAKARRRGEGAPPADGVAEAETQAEAERRRRRRRRLRAATPRQVAARPILAADGAVVRDNSDAKFNRCSQSRALQRRNRSAPRAGAAAAVEVTAAARGTAAAVLQRCGAHKQLADGSLAAQLLAPCCRRTSRSSRRRARGQPRGGEGGARRGPRRAKGLTGRNRWRSVATTARAGSGARAALHRLPSSAGRSSRRTPATTSLVREAHYMYVFTGKGSRSAAAAAVPHFSSQEAALSWSDRPRGGGARPERSSGPPPRRASGSASAAKPRRTAAAAAPCGGGRLPGRAVPDGRHLVAPRAATRAIGATAYRGVSEQKSEAPQLARSTASDERVRGTHGHGVRHLATAVDAHLRARRSRGRATA